MKRFLTVLLLAFLLFIPTADAQFALKDGNVLGDGFIEPYDLEYGMTGYWKLEQASQSISGADTLQADYGFGGHSADMSAIVSYPSGPRGKANGAIQFNGTSTYGRITSFDPTGGSGAALSAFGWVKGKNSNGRHVISQFDDGANERAFGLEYYPSMTGFKVTISDDGTVDGAHVKQYWAAQELIGMLTASDAGGGDYFGYSCALSADGSVLAVGAFYWDGSAGNDQVRCMCSTGQA